MSIRNQSQFGALKYRCLWLSVGWSLIIADVYLALVPVTIAQPMSFPYADKLTHLLIYSLLMSWFSNIYIRPAHRTAAGGGLVMLGVALEFAQGWTDYRSYEGMDMIANATGVIAGWLASPPRLPNYLLFFERLTGRR